MKKTLLCLTFGLAAFLAVPKASAGQYASEALDRSGWTVTGCSQHNANGNGKDGGFRHIIDGNTETFWHSEYGNNSHKVECPHYFIIDRGENAAATPFQSFGYLPRQGSTGNGFVNDYEIYVLDDITGLNVAPTVANGTASIVADDHASLTTFLEGKTPTLNGKLNRVQNDAEKRKISGGVFPEQQTGRYVLFVVKSVSSVDANKHANCAEFYLYSPFAPENRPYYVKLAETENYLQLESSSNGAHAQVSNSVKTPVFLIQGTGTNANKFAIRHAKTGKYFSSDASWNSTYNNTNAYYWTIGEIDPGILTIAQNANAANLAGTQADTTIWTDNYMDRTKDEPNGWTAKVKWAFEECNDWIFPEEINSESVDNPKYILIKNLRTNRGEVTYAVTPGESGKLQLKLASELNIDDRYDCGALWYVLPAGAIDSDGYQPVRLYNAYTDEAITNPANGTWATEGDDTIWYLKANTNGGYTGYCILHAKNLTNNAYGWNDEGGSGLQIGYWKGNDAGSIWAFEVADEAKVNATKAKLSEAYEADRKVYVDLINSYVDLGLISFTEEQQTAWTTASTARINSVNQLHSYMATLHNLVSAATVTPVSDGQGRHVQFLHNQRPVYIGQTSSGVKRGGTDGTRTFTLKNAADGSGFYIYHEYSNAYVKQPASDNTNISMVSAQSEASIYNFDLSNATKGLVGVKVVGPAGHVSNDHPYWHSNGADDVTNVVRWEHGDNSAWYIHFTDEAQAANEYLAGALAASANMPETTDEVGFLSGNMTAVNAVNAARAEADALADDADSSAKRAVADAIYEVLPDALATAVLNYPKSGEIYTITSSDGRGYLTANTDTSIPYVWSSGKTGYHANANKWAVIMKDGKTYLYNVHTGKFANAYGYKAGDGLEGVTYAWILSEVPTEVTINGEKFSQPTGGASRPFVIEGGEDTSGKNRPGMMIIDWLGSPVPAIAGFGSETDGCGFRFVKVEVASEEQMAAIEAAIDNAEALVAETRAAAEAMVPENYRDIVNHYSEEGVTAFNAKLDEIGEDATPDKEYSLTKHAMQTLDAADRTIAMTDGLCYSIANVADGKMYHALFGVTSTEDYEIHEGDDVEAAYNWNCSVEGDVVYFKHNNNGVEVKFALDGTEMFTVSAGTKVGQVKLTPFGSAAEAPARRVAALSDEDVAAGEPEYVLTSQGEGAGFTTTAIAEINAAADNGADAIYDLQGRRLAAPAKGINIINGKKILVK